LATSGFAVISSDPNGFENINSVSRITSRGYSLLRQHKWRRRVSHHNNSFLIYLGSEYSWNNGPIINVICPSYGF
jgi:hypothetical protein